MKPPRQHKPSVNNYFLTMPADLHLDDVGPMRHSTPVGIKRSMSSDLFGRKFSNHKASMESLNQRAHVQDIGSEIRSQLDQAKEEINILQFEFEKRLQKESMRLGLQSQQPLFTQAATDPEQTFARLEVFEQEITQTL